MVGLAVAAAVSACGGHVQATAPLTNAADRFLSRYVTDDGRVIRHDQGGDIVSEGQAYGMLIAELAQRPALVRTIWSWTKNHLARPDGLFAWHATGSGQVEDPQSASDADVLIAYALLRYSGPGAASLHRAGRSVASAVLAHEAVRLGDGALLLTAGPWATSGSPTVDPSYLMPGIFQAVGRSTGDARWHSAATAAVSLVAQLTADGHRLPPDWAQLTGGRLSAIPAPGGSAGIQYGQDAVRLPLWFATACSSGARTLAAGWWHNVLSVGTRASAFALSLDGAIVNPQPSPVALLAAAAAAQAAGETTTSRRLRTRAASLARRAPTYYGDAWAALGPALLDDALASCP